MNPDIEFSTISRNLRLSGISDFYSNATLKGKTHSDKNTSFGLGIYQAE